MMKKRSKKQLLLWLTAVGIFISSLLTSPFSRAYDATQYYQDGYYQIYYQNQYLGNLADLNELQNELIKRYGDKAKQEVYLAADGVFEYVASGAQYVDFLSFEELFNQVSFEIDGVQIDTAEGKTFYVDSYGSWLRAVGNATDFVSRNRNKSDTHIISGEVKVGDDFQINEGRVSLSQVMNTAEVERMLLFSTLEKVGQDQILDGDTVEAIATRNDMSVTQLRYLNKLQEADMLVPGMHVDVSPLQYAIEFSYPIIESRYEDIAFSFEYIEDATMEEGTEEIVQTGVNGVAYAQYVANIVNGVSVPGEQLAFEVISEPVVQIVKKGTKPKVVARPPQSGGVRTDAPFANEAGLIWPAIGICISAEYGWYEYGRHYGIDIAGRTGDPIWSAAAGTVEEAGFSGAFGYTVVVNHGNGIRTRYAHLSSIGTNVGKRVAQGEYLGGMGTTGQSDGVHLHFEVIVNGDRLNPRGYLPNESRKTCY